MCVCVCVCVCVCTLSCSVVSDSATPWTVAHNSLFMGFAKRKYWSGLPFPSPVFFCELHSVIMKKYLKTHVKTLTICFLTIYFLCVCVLTQSCLTLYGPKDSSLPVSSPHGIFQARILEWGISCSRESFQGRD